MAQNCTKGIALQDFRVEQGRHELESTECAVLLGEIAKAE